MERPGRPLRVLIVDCHQVFRVAARALLETEGLQVLDDVEPAALVRQMHASVWPDVVLVDVCLDRLDGLDLARRLASVPRRPAIVLMSTASADELLTAAAGADAFLSKAAVTAARLASVAATARDR